MGRLTNATVLYIEDNSANQELMEAIIGRMGGMSLISAENAALGISMAEEQQPDLILMDINLPGMDGIAAKKVLDLKETTKDIPVIAISGAATSDDLDQGEAVGFKAYLTKPFRISDVADAIKMHLRQP